MHRLLGRFVIGAGALLMAATAHAQGTTGSDGRPFKLGGALGATLPLGDYSDQSDLGFHFGGLIEYKPQAVPVNLRGEITYHRSGLKSDVFDDVSDGHASILAFIGNVVVPFGDAASTARPFGIGGIGIYHTDLSGDAPNNTTRSRTETKFGLNLGGGFTFNLSGFETFVEARFNSVFTEGSNKNFMPISFGFKF
jgi:opacity protein-like surface antigen